MLNLDSGDLFEMSTLTAEVNQEPLVPDAVGRLFQGGTEGIATTAAVVDLRDGQISLIDDKNRGDAPNAADGYGAKQPVSLIARHFPVEETITPANFQNIRMFGSDDQLATLKSERDKALDNMRKRHSLTLEDQRFSALTGSITNAVGGAIDLMGAFGKTQVVSAMGLDVAATDVRRKIVQAKRASKAAMKNIKISGWLAICAPDYFDEFSGHDATKEAFDRFQDGAALRDDLSESGFNFGQVEWIEYDGPIASGEAFLCPVADIYQTRFAPGDFVEAANTVGLPMYVKARELDYGKGIGLWSESNPISWVSVPDAIIKLTAGSV